MNFHIQGAALIIINFYIFPQVRKINRYKLTLLIIDIKDAILFFHITGIKKKNEKIILNDNKSYIHCCTELSFVALHFYMCCIAVFIQTFLYTGNT